MKFRGIVIKGKNKGNKLGFPTANVKIRENLESGVYEGKVEIKREGYGAAVFKGKDKDFLEAHILDFSENLYGKEIEVKILKKIREEIKFKDDKELKEQIKKDIYMIKRINLND